MSVIKKFFFGDKIPLSKSNINASFHHLRPELQKRFSNGVKYNMKLVIRGDRGTGKSALFTRLKGEAIDTNYTPTDEIQVACILWSYKETDEVVKVEVWDVVDHGRPPPSQITSKLSRHVKKPQPIQSACLDSSFVDVYKAASGVIIVFDISKKSTFEYVKRELPRVPYFLPVLVMANCCDKYNEHQMHASEVRHFIDRVCKDRAQAANTKTANPVNNKPAPIRFCEASMANGFGLLYVHRFLNIPFLALQRVCLLRLLAVNSQAYHLVQDELDNEELNESEICSYQKFCKCQKTYKQDQLQQAHVATKIATIETNGSSMSENKDRFDQTTTNRNLHQNIVNNNHVSFKPHTNEVSLGADFQKDINPADVKSFPTPTHNHNRKTDQLNLTSRFKPISTKLSNPPSSIDSESASAYIRVTEDEFDDGDDDLNEDNDDANEEHLRSTLRLHLESRIDTDLSSLSDDNPISTTTPVRVSSKPIAKPNDGFQTPEPPLLSINGIQAPNECIPVVFLSKDEKDAFERFLDED